uniref:Transposable element P transposase-like RNase H domain-containing protein n=1 Tax=Glossina palpalis gambiensis TaxID=67801 RepID=A0A1B0APT5_9MUSC
RTTINARNDSGENTANPSKPACRARSRGGNSHYIAGLSPRDKVVTLQFDEVYTDLNTTYIVDEERLDGCEYDAETKEKKHKRVLIFGVLSMLTAFNMLISTHAFVKSHGGKRLLKKNMDLAEEMCFHVKAIVCDRSQQNCKMLQLFQDGVYYKTHREGRIYKIVQIFDYIHLAATHYEHMRKNDQYDAHILYLCIEERIFEGVLPSVLSPWTLPQIFGYYEHVIPAFIKSAMNKNIFSDPKVRRTYEYIDAITKIYIILFWFIIII